jgi:hypothetical protein
LIVFDTINFSIRKGHERVSILSAPLEYNRGCIAVERLTDAFAVTEYQLLSVAFRNKWIVRNQG